MRPGSDHCASGPRAVAAETGNLPPLLHQIRHALQRLLERGETTTIDLRRMPLSAAERERLRRFLGRGEVSVRLEALGESDILESAFPGVWLVTHRDVQGGVMGEFIEIATVPGLLAAGPDDLKDAVGAIQAALEAT